MSHQKSNSRQVWCFTFLPDFRWSFRAVASATLGCVPFIILCQPTTCFRTRRALFKESVDRKAIVNLTGRFVSTGWGSWKAVQLIKMELCCQLVHAWRNRKTRGSAQNLRSFHLLFRRFTKLSLFFLSHIKKLCLFIKCSISTCKA